MSSYCLTLMIIAYLQHRGILPNLQGKVKTVSPDDFARQDQDVIWVGWGKNQGIKANIGFERAPPSTWKPSEPGLTAAQALRDFFSFFNRTRTQGDRFDYSKEILSILQGGVASRAKPQGQTQREDDNMRREMAKAGKSIQEIDAAVKAWKAKMDLDRPNIGKGDQGIQSKLWEEKTLVVQDPFLWQKASHIRAPSSSLLTSRTARRT